MIFRIPRRLPNEILSIYNRPPKRPKDTYLPQSPPEEGRDSVIADADSLHAS